MALGQARTMTLVQARFMTLGQAQGPTPGQGLGLALGQDLGESFPINGLSFKTIFRFPFLIFLGVFS